MLCDATSGSRPGRRIKEDVCARYTPGPGKLRLVVITDGVDTHSPPPYRGMGGMDPMMEHLHQTHQK